MNARAILLILVLSLFGVSVCHAGDVNMGTWKLNDAKSKLVAGNPKNNTVVYAAEGDSIKVTVDGVDGAGKPTHNVWTGKFDGKDYAVTGDPTADMRAYKTVDDHTLELTTKKGGKTTSTGRIVVAADGKSRTLTLSGTDSTGKKFNSEAAYDKQ